MEENDVGKAKAVVQPRAYQLELFEASMDRNIVVTMDTGSGKTQVAKLRIEAELERCAPEKLVWFLAPTVVLAEQQHEYLTNQLPAYQSRLICGSDNVQHWSTPAIWNAVLQDIRIVISTSRILLDALVHSFIRLKRVALLVFDEAHHCSKRDPTNRIMQEFYHTFPADQLRDRPHILGLSASPITNGKTDALEILEHNMNAICKAPTRHIEELQRYVHQPQLCRLTHAYVNMDLSPGLQRLGHLLDPYDLSSDPYVRFLQQDDSHSAQRRLEKVMRKGATDSREQLKTLHRRTIELEDQIGRWASTYLLRVSLKKARDKVDHFSTGMDPLGLDEAVFLHSHLSAIIGQEACPPCDQVPDDYISPKAMTLLNYLAKEYTEDMSGIIFVKERGTAAMLALLVSMHPITSPHFRAAPFVGESNFAKKQTVADLADSKAQKAALAAFRSGKRNLLVCTSVLEEGVDVSSMNLVIRFDEPANFRAFIQSRGRARMVESKFVLMCGENDPEARYERWKGLEAEMKAKYMDDRRQLAKQVENEDVGEEYDEYISSTVTGARLSIDDARGHLEHFCDGMPAVPYGDAPRPEFILSKRSEDEFTARVVLPATVNMAERCIRGKGWWKSEKMAVKDAAFQAYKVLYEAGLINENLLPQALPDPIVLWADETDEEKSKFWVQERMSPWTRGLEWTESVRPHVLTIRVQSPGMRQLPEMHLILPALGEMNMSFNLHWTKDQMIEVQIRPEQVIDGLPKGAEFRELCRQSTMTLFESVRLGRMKIREGMLDTLPFLLTPVLEATSLRQWLTDQDGIVNVLNYEKLGPESGLIHLGKSSEGSRPYTFCSVAVRSRDSRWLLHDHDSNSSQPPAEEMHFEVKALPRRLDYLHPPGSETFNAATEFLPVTECYVSCFPSTYATLMLLFPSILHKIELRAVAVALREGILSSVKFRRLELVEAAICASAAREKSNYQRLELIGDSILKFWTSAQLCAQFPTWHEGYLSRGKDRVVSNSHLCQASRKTGLDEYIHTKAFSGSRWRPPTAELGISGTKILQPREMSSKVLADVVEALIGACFMDGEDEQDRNAKIKGFLTIFLTGVSWRSAVENASILRDLVPDGGLDYANFDSVKNITGFTFQKNVLLVEALTHPSCPSVGIQRSYQRLEFLGDAVLDFIVTEAMTRWIVEISHFDMHLIRTSVVNAHLLAFFCLGSGFEQDRTEVKTESSGNVKIQTAKKKTYLWEYIKSSGRRDFLNARGDCVRRYHELANGIQVALDSGTSYPWYQLLCLNAEKFLSDIIESILGAIFVDSRGNMQACRAFLDKLGLLAFLDRVMADQVDVMHPKERLGILAGNSEVKYISTREVVEGATGHSCTVYVDNVPVATTTGEINRAAAEAKVAGRAVTLLRERWSREVKKAERGM